MNDAPASQTPSARPVSGTGLRRFGRSFAGRGIRAAAPAPFMHEHPAHRRDYPALRPKPSDKPAK